MRRIALSFLITVTAFAVAGCGGNDANVGAFSSEAGKVKVATSFYPLYDFTRAVGGDKVTIVNMVPSGTEPHEWEPTSKHLQVLSQAQVFVYNGAGFEHWVEKTLSSLDNKALVAVEAAKGFELVEGAGEDEHDHAEEAGLDPHIWLDPNGAIHQVKQVRDALIKVDAANKTTYEANADAYIKQLKALDEEFRSGLTGCGKREFFTSHSAFTYLAHRYGLEQHAIMGLSPDAEPKPQEMAKIVAEAKEHEIKYIFFETLVSDKVSKTVAREVGAQTLVLNPLEGLTEAEEKAGKDYLAVMRDNLANLKTALECAK